MVVTFAAQGLSHFVVNKDHFAAIFYMRENPIMPLGFMTMVIQGLIMSISLRAWQGEVVTIANGLAVAFAFGAFFISYVAFAEPAKYQVPNITAWIKVEMIVGLLQFSVFGVLLGFIHTKLG